MNTKLTTEQKNSIRDSLKEYVESFGSQNKAAYNLEVSPATLSSIHKRKYEKISDEMWLNIATKIGGTKQKQSVQDGSSALLVETSVTKDLVFCMRENRVNKDFIWAISPAGSGKTAIAKMARREQNTFYLLCDEDMCKKEFALEFARATGLRVKSYKNSRKIIMDVVDYIRSQKDVLIIFDEADKLSDKILNYFITIFNYFEDMAGNRSVGIQFISTDYIATRMERGLRFKKKGYQELWSRLGARFYELDRNTSNDIEAICRARGVVNQRDINEVIKEADRANYDLRRVTRKINAILRKNKQQGV